MFNSITYTEKRKKTKRKKYLWKGEENGCEDKRRWLQLRVENMTSIDIKERDLLYLW